MMGWKEIRFSLIKFLGKEANSNELENLELWLQNGKNKEDFDRYVKIHFLISYCMTKYDVDKAKQKVQWEIYMQKRQKKLFYLKRFSLAASVILLIGLVYFQSTIKENDGFARQEIIAEDSDEAVLTLDNGKQVTLTKGTRYEISGVISNGNEIVYERQKPLQKQLGVEQHFLTIPRGGEIVMELSDGSKVWLNSESQIKYPTSFPNDKIRLVELVYGEAYFEVSPSEENNGMPFKVATGFQEIEVMGTGFNVKAYKEDADITTTLVEGSIAVRKNNTISVLRPAQQSKITAYSDSIQVLNVNTTPIISWTKGLFSFEEESLNEIMKTLSRWYDVEVFFKSAKSKDFLFTGVLRRTSSIADILKFIEKSGEGDVRFEINDRVVLIK